MKAFIVRKPGDYGIVDLPVPSISDDEILLRVKAAGICHSDLDVMDGVRKHAVQYPNVLGHEFTGIIEACGKNVVGLKTGDKVSCECMVWCGSCRFCANGFFAQCSNYSELGMMRAGAFAEYVAVPYRLAHKYNDIAIEQAAVVECAGNSYKAVELASILPGDRVAVIGPGPIGIYAIEFAKLKQPRQIICVGTRSSRLEYAKLSGATDIVNITTEDAYEEIMKITDGEGVDSVIQCATTSSAFDLAVRVAGKASRIVIEGISSSGSIIDFDINQFILKPFTIIGATGANSSQFEAVLRLLEMKTIDLGKIITHVLPFERILEGFNMLRTKQDGVVKVVVTM